MQARKAPKAPKARAPQSAAYGATHARASHAAGPCVVVAIADTAAGLCVVGRVVAPVGRRTLARAEPVPARGRADAYRKGNAAWLALAADAAAQSAQPAAPTPHALPERARVLRPAPANA